MTMHSVLEDYGWAFGAQHCCAPTWLRQRWSFRVWWGCGFGTGARSWQDAFVAQGKPALPVGGGRWVQRLQSVGGDRIL